MKEENKWLENFFPEYLNESLQLEIAGFSAKEALEPTLERWIGNICALQSAFEIRLNNFSSFLPGTIYVRVQDQVPFLHFVEKIKFLDAFIQSNECPPVQFASRALIVLGHNLPETIFDEAQKYYSGRTFHSSFLLGKLGLLKHCGPDAGYRMLNTFTLPGFSG